MRIAAAALFFGAVGLPRHTPDRGCPLASSSDNCRHAGVSGSRGATLAAGRVRGKIDMPCASVRQMAIRDAGFALAPRWAIPQFALATPSERPRPAKLIMDPSASFAVELIVESCYK